MWSKPIIYTSIVVSAASPLLLHEQSERDCSPRIELCPPSDALFLPDGHEPERAPVLGARPVMITSTAARLTGPVVQLINRPSTSS
jgi:hypothetical protein